jgi:hypothetical protein
MEAGWNTGVSVQSFLMFILMAEDFKAISNPAFYRLTA